MSPRLRSVMSAFVLSFLVASCGDGGTNVQDLSTVAVSPGTGTLTSFGATQQLNASARDMAGTVVTGGDVTFAWTSSAPGVASVSSSGLVTAISEGSTTITASVTGGSASGSATITVDQRAAAITLAVADDTLTTGTTTQATASGEDAGGAALASPDFSWSSSDPTVATVDGSGLVTGISDGDAVITASQDGTDATASLVVVRPNVTLAADTMLGGMVVVDDLTIMAGTTVMLANDLEIDANGVVDIAGMVMGDCLGVKIEGDGAVTVSGTINNACATQLAAAGDSAPMIEINAPGGVDLTDATIVSSGAILVTSEPSSAFLARVASRGAASPGAAFAPTLRAMPNVGTIDLSGATMRADPSEVPQPASTADRAPTGANYEFRATVDMILDGTTMEAQSGGPGAPASGSSASHLNVRGGAGGSGGDITISIPEGGTIRLRSTKGQTKLLAGDGGPGGPATATTTQNPDIDPAPEATANGGDGGEGGSVSIFGAATIQQGSNVSDITRQVGLGGRGGNATAIAADGVDATGARPAQVGGLADAVAGAGGNAGTIAGGFVGMPAPDGKQGGGGGVALATGGKGGDGIRSNPDAAMGGSSVAFGGRGGSSTNAGGRGGGDAIANGGNGGNGADVCPAFQDNSLTGSISVNSDPASSDQFIFQAGAGTSLGLVYRILNQLGGPGGRGGGGAFLGAAGGQGGFGRAVQAPKGIGSIGSGGNGGNGGAGVPGGSGGSGGSPRTENDSDASQSNPIFQAGSGGGGCASSVAGATSSVLALAVNQADQTIEINGSGAWVNVTGTLSDDGTVTGTARGTVAGVPNILVEFAGSWDETTKTLQGTYTMDSEKVIVSGHPVVYNVTATGN